MTPTATPAVSLSDQLAALAANPNPRKGPKCSVARALTQVESEQDTAVVDQLAALLDDTGVPATKLAVVLRGNGLLVGHDAIRRHRNRSTGTGCACPR